MGSSPSKATREDALVLCKDRMRHIRRSIDSRDALSAAHLSYTQSLRSVGTALRRYAESEISPESSLFISEVDKSPSHSSMASPSPSRAVENVSSPVHQASQMTPPSTRIHYMKAAGATPITITIDPSAAEFVGQESPVSTFVPPPPPLPPELCTSWDFFDPIAAAGSASSNNENGLTLNFSRLKGLRDSREAEVVPLKEDNKEEAIMSDRRHTKLPCGNTSSKQESEPKQSGMSKPSQMVDASTKATSSEQVAAKVEESEMEKELCAETEDPSEFITHRAKDFVSSMKDIETRFIRAAEAGNEVSRMLETKKIRLDICAKIPGSPSKPPTAQFVSALRVCCNRDIILNQETAQHVSKVVTWKRSVSSLSSSSKSALMPSMIKDDVDDSNSDFVEEFAMVSGSHSSTLDRLHAWERKLYDEIKASENVRKAYDEKCNLLRRQFARGLNAQLIDKTRAVVKDLHSRVSVAIQAVDAISKRIEKIRDEELQPQLVELIQGLIRMWKSMLECHHKQFITISLAYHVKGSTTVQQGEHHRQAAMHMWNDMDCFSSSFKNWITAHKLYVEALNAWLQKCVLQPPQRRRKRKVSFPPRQAVSPPIFVLCRDWLAMMESLPTDELCMSIKDVMQLIRSSFEHQDDQNKPKSELQECGMLENNVREEVSGSVAAAEGLQSRLTTVLDRLTKFSEASLKCYEELKQNYEMACDDYRRVGPNAQLV
ncbi:protein ALTERED PHOSPHATE STARVATION RESPONSE 1-like [Phragmites australis]|uniref:protein ALTERED PHOSPHATE STARVATION RESPONSE 1-like n=1 Tax=Phragmites australis TaxID=29695 RepID=UPI002D76D4B3|nr:protein ALTERED PHOSPHATE STARVATION RESPONSE 1-like [Phragmites australis]XP_062198038.1 protein ALTERED PHOSPHATE STARVATION RESPONSE 1-like [Phragmites australis]XP_062198039.1 protein ALTERED PHOSPHATE STARVATION RESPONSE 1-like [Phragmites australis]XP_062198040.1 protein ALTERED PHOSPHATE STARVATION RESPONSE 1-like [Phragmites australis]XP_062198041.1 protein ALTERED PHOSPHATE STARVATION RESPONSE 1-like [Phragmites australis]